ncbi:MAG TPA: hypothetical protein VFS40_16600 [Gemmatimonadales bacterium]|nr:hypothetical protein [Gemmatimonadales bacterium]
MTMRVALTAGLALAVGVMGCEKGRRSAMGGGGGDTTKTVQDTIVTQRAVQDTMVVKTDTTVKTDTSVKRGTGAANTPRDTLKDTRGTKAGADTSRMRMRTDTARMRMPGDTTRR